MSSANTIKTMTMSCPGCVGICIQTAHINLYVGNCGSGGHTFSVEPRLDLCDQLPAPTRDRFYSFEHSARRRRIQPHDLRATFVTVRLANGWTESTELNRNWLAARIPYDLHQSDFAPMVVAIPELRALAESEGGDAGTATPGGGRTGGGVAAGDGTESGQRTPEATSPSSLPLSLRRPSGSRRAVRGPCATGSRPC